MRHHRLLGSRSTIPVGLIAAATLFLASCSEEAAEEKLVGTEPIAGTFPLIKVDGQALPFIQAPIPNRDGTISPCDIIIPSGFLELAGGGFRLQYETRNSCTNALFSTWGHIGTFRQDGDLLTFAVHRPSAPDRDFTFEGRITPDEIITFYLDFDLTFER